MSVSFGGIGEIFASFDAADGLAAAGPVKMSANGTVSACAEGDRFCGVAAHVTDDGIATVQLKGYVRCAYTGTAPSVGYTKLAAGDTGAVAVSDNGGEYLVVDVDTADATVGFIM